MKIVLIDKNGAEPDVLIAENVNSDYEKSMIALLNFNISQQYFDNRATKDNCFVLKSDDYELFAGGMTRES